MFVPVRDHDDSRFYRLGEIVGPSFMHECDAMGNRPQDGEVVGNREIV